MNRNEEYLELIAELENNVPDLQPFVRKARNRRKKAVFLYRPLASAAACFAAFVLTVNFCAPVACACARVPVLKELAAAVTFSRSLSAAVENGYVQPMDLTQTQNGVTAEMDSLIVDQKQVNIFFRLSSEAYAHLDANATVLTAQGESPKACIYGVHPDNGEELRTMTVDFVDGDVPGALRIQLNVYNNDPDEVLARSEPVDRVIPGSREDYIATFDFLLEFDPELTAAGKILSVDRTVELDGQKITVTQVEVYPTHMRINVQEDPGNTAWLAHLDFYLETDEGTRFTPVVNGISATGAENTPSMISYRADSVYFHEADHFHLVITGAQWLDKDMDKTWVNLKTGETGVLPQGTALESVEKTGSGWTVTFRRSRKAGQTLYSCFGNRFYDPEGKEYEIDTYHLYDPGEVCEDGDTASYFECIFLRGYTYGEVWLTPRFSRNWLAEEPITVPIQ